jgi:hypothetical protein
MKKCWLTGRIVIPGDPEYDLAREEFNTRYDLFPSGFLSNSPSSENKVQFQALSGRAGEVCPTQTAYVHRKALFSLFILRSGKMSKKQESIQSG